MALLFHHGSPEGKVFDTVEWEELQVYSTAKGGSSGRYIYAESVGHQSVVIMFSLQLGNIR